MTDVPTGPLRCSKCNSIEKPGNPLRRCSNCKKPHYCSRACQKADWKAVHKQICLRTDVVFDEVVHENWPEQQMPAHIYPHNTHLANSRKAGENANDILLNQDEPTTYKLLIESFRVWDETKRCGLGKLEDPRSSFANGSVTYNTGYLFGGLMRHIMSIKIAGNPQQMLISLQASAEKLRGVLPPWWSPYKREACINIAKTMYHWDDLPEAGVPKEVNGWRRYGGPEMRVPLRMIGMKIEGIGAVEAVRRGYYKVHWAPNGQMTLFPGNMQHEVEMQKREDVGLKDDSAWERTHAPVVNWD